MEDTRSTLHLVELFTQTYREHESDHYASRDLSCLQVQFPAAFQSIEEGDFFAGRVQFLPVGFRPTGEGNKLFYSLRSLEALREKCKGEEVERIDQILNYWRAKARKVDEIHFPNDVLARFNVSLERLIRQGIQGLLEDIQSCRFENPTKRFFELANVMVEGLELLKSTCLAYANHARSKADDCECDKRKCQFQKIAVVLESLTDQPPTTTREALQLVLLFSIMTGRRSFDHLSRFLSPLVERDINLGVATVEETKCMFSSFIALMNEWMPGQFGEFSPLFEHLYSLSNKPQEYILQF